MGELDRYEERLIEEWQIFFERMKEDLGEEAAEAEKVKQPEPSTSGLNLKQTSPFGHDAPSRSLREARSTSSPTTFEWAGTPTSLERVKKVLESSEAGA